MPAPFSAEALATDVAAQADALLCDDRQFGDSDAIDQRNLARFRLGLTILARDDEPSSAVLRTTAASDDSRLRPVLYDPVLRNCFERDLAQRERGEFRRSSFAAHLPGSAPESANGDAAPAPCEALTLPHHRAWPGLGRAWLLTELAPQDGEQEKLAQRLTEMYRDALGSRGEARPVIPTDEVRAVLREGAELLATLLPSTGRSVLGHISLVGFTRREDEEGPLQSMSGGDPLPSAVLLAPERCTSPWLAAESLLHEGSHLKLFDALRTGAVVRNGTERVPIPWRVGSWTVIRCLVALHFYAHLMIFRAAAAGADGAVLHRFGPPSDVEDLDEPTPGTPAALSGQYRTSAERAHYLAQCMLSLPEETLTQNGHRFARWLLTTLRLVDVDAPRPPERAEATQVLNAHEEQPAPSTPAARDGVLHRVAPVDACPLPDLGQLVVSSAQSPRMHWLNARAWMVYSLCDGRDPGAVRVAYARAAGLGDGSPEAGQHVDAALQRLLTAGLITADRPT